MHEEEVGDPAGVTSQHAEQLPRFHVPYLDERVLAAAEELPARLIERAACYLHAMRIVDDALHLHQP